MLLINHAIQRNFFRYKKKKKRKLHVDPTIQKNDGDHSVVRKQGSIVRHDTNRNPNPNPYTILSPIPTHTLPLTLPLIPTTNLTLTLTLNITLILSNKW